MTEALYVLGLKKNLISVSTIEERGFEVVFKDGQVLIYPNGGSIISAKVIGVSHGKLYRFLFQGAGELISSVSGSTHSGTSSRELCELWHMMMAHLHHGALRILRKITTGVLDFSIEHYDVCRGCAMGKYAKSPFPARDNRAAGILDDPYKC